MSAVARNGSVAVFDPSKYTAIEKLRDGRALEIRAFWPEDRAGLLAAADRVGPRSRYLRFFTLKRDFTDKEKAFFLNVDFDRHVALVGLVEEATGKSIVGGGRYVVTEPGTAEVAFTVVDKYQGQGVGTALLRHLIIAAREGGLHKLIAEVLPENRPMLHLFETSGLPVRIAAEPEVVHVAIQLR
jgi:GNAT superfamily N-acetyltransferase